MNIRPKRSLGQNFLRDRSIASRIVAALDAGPDDRVVEIGPGQGALTDELFARSCVVYAIEFDRDLVEGLAARFSEKSDFHLINADALEFDFRTLQSAGGGQLKLVANLPYNISTPILRRLVQVRNFFSVLVLMFQREVVDRITAHVGNRDRGYLTVLVENAFNIERLFDVNPRAFYPVPKVWSSVVRLTPLPADGTDDDSLERLLSVAFIHKRKTLLNNLVPTFTGASTALVACGIDPKRRPETLTIAEWKQLSAALQS
jgi:16S rRNA (adenine1518-N6/adenine1519-N6)-dimethyltransferase